MIATRQLSDGSRVTAFPLGRTPDGTTGNVAGGFCPYENLLLPQAQVEFLHASLEQDGHGEFEPDDPDSYAPDPDKRYKVKTYSGSITVPDGSATVGGVVQYYAKTTTDDRVVTYSLDYATYPGGWIETSSGSRTTGSRFVYATGPDPEPDRIDVGGPIDSPTGYTEAATVYAGDGISVALTEIVTASEMQAWCQDKLDDLKERVDDPEDTVSADSVLDSYYKETLSIKIAAARMRWTGSGLFDPLDGKLKFPSCPMAPDFNLTAGMWKLEVSNEITGSDKYYDDAGMFGDATWWPAGFSLFGTSDLSFINPGGAVYPHSGISPGAAWTEQHLRWISLDGKKRKFSITYPDGDDTPRTVTKTTAKRDGLANCTDWLVTHPTPTNPYGVVTRVALLNDDGSEASVEYDPDADPPVFMEFSQVAVVHKSRLLNRWGVRGFTGLLPGPDEEHPSADPLDKYYRTITISSTGLEYAADDDPTPDFGLTGMTATGSMSGTKTLTKPSEWKLGSLDAQGRFSRVMEDDQSPFKLDWAAGGKTGTYEITIANASGFISIANPPFAGSGDEVDITETHYQVTRAAPDTPPIRDYRKQWPRVNASPSPAPDVGEAEFSLDGPSGSYGDDGYTTEQKSDWQDLGLPDPGDAWVSEAATDEFSCWVGSLSGS